MSAFYARSRSPTLRKPGFLENIEGVGQYYGSLKRAGEFFLASAFVVGLIFAPRPRIIVALVVKLSSPGPVVYRQTRVGQNGKLFTLYKFRTMRKRCGKAWGTVVSGSNDARVTPFGKFLRASHLDELPQLWNISRGDISFVGPDRNAPNSSRT